MEGMSGSVLEVRVLSSHAVAVNARHSRRVLETRIDRNVAFRQIIRWATYFVGKLSAAIRDTVRRECRLLAIVRLPCLYEEERPWKASSCAQTFV